MHTTLKFGNELDIEGSLSKKVFYITDGRYISCRAEYKDYGNELWIYLMRPDGFCVVAVTKGRRELGKRGGDCIILRAMLLAYKREILFRKFNMDELKGAPVS